MAYLLAAAAGLASATIVLDALTKARQRSGRRPRLPHKDRQAAKSDLVESDEGKKSSGLSKQLKGMLARTDERYQAFICTRIDPLLAGHARERYLQVLMDGRERQLTLQEKRTNRRLGFGVAALELLGVVYLTGQPLLPFVIAIGIYNLWPWYRQAYVSAVEERKLRIIHLIAFYFSWMWLGGYYLVGAVGSIFSALCQKIQLITQIGARQDLIGVFGQQPRQVWVDIDGVEVEIPFDQLRIGDILVLDAGQMAPVDGVVVEGTATLDQHRLTGEAQPVEKEKGDPVLACSLVLAGRLRVRVEKAGADTAAAQISTILNRTVDYGVENLANELGSVEHTLWPMLAGGALGWLVAGPVAGAAALGCNYVVGVVPLGMITLLNALSTGSNHGILIKDGRALEILKDIDILVFDKTGTLTLEQPRLVRIHVHGNRTENELLTLAATAEHRQTHPVALAILAAAHERGLQLPLIDATQYEVGYGLKVKIDGCEVLVGSQRYMYMEQIAIPAAFEPEIERCREEGRSLVYVAAGNELAGMIELDAALRPEAKAIVQWLRASGISLYIISGDQEAPTRRLAEELGMDGYFANTLPEGKATLVQQLKASGRKVGFIGDGINDAIALRQADVSISFRAATNVASDCAQIVLMDDNLEQLRVLFNLVSGYEKNLGANYRQSVVMSLIAAAGVFLLPYKFMIVEGLWVVEFAAGIVVATRPLLVDDQEKTDGPAAEKPSVWDQKGMWFFNYGHWPFSEFKGLTSTKTVS